MADYQDQTNPFSYYEEWSFRQQMVSKPNDSESN